MNAEADRLTVTQYRDPITSEARTVTTCPEHTARLLHVLRAAGVGCGSTYSPSFNCDPCKNEMTTDQTEHDARCKHPKCPGGSLCCCQEAKAEAWDEWLDDGGRD